MRRQKCSMRVKGSAFVAYKILFKYDKSIKIIENNVLTPDGALRRKSNGERRACRCNTKNRHLNNRDWRYAAIG